MVKIPLDIFIFRKIVAFYFLKYKSKPHGEKHQAKGLVHLLEWNDEWNAMDEWNARMKWI